MIEDQYTLGYLLLTKEEIEKICDSLIEQMKLNSMDDIIHRAVAVPDILFSKHDCRLHIGIDWAAKEFSTAAFDKFLDVNTILSESILDGPILISLRD